MFSEGSIDCEDWGTTTIVDSAKLQGMTWRHDFRNNHSDRAVVRQEYSIWSLLDG